MTTDETFMKLLLLVVQGGCVGGAAPPANDMYRSNVFFFSKLDDYRRNIHEAVVVSCAEGVRARENSHISAKRSGLRNTGLDFDDFHHFCIVSPPFISEPKHLSAISEIQTTDDAADYSSTFD